MPIVKVNAPEQASAYDIHIGHGLLKNAATLLAMCRGRRAMIVTDENVAPLYLDTLSWNWRGHRRMRSFCPQAKRPSVWRSLNASMTR